MHDELFSFKTFTNFAIFFKYCATNLSYIRSCFTCIADMTSRFQTTAAVFYLTSSGRPARSSLYRRQAGVSSFWCHRLERPASHVTSAPSLSVFGQRLDLSVFPFLPGHYDMTRVLLLPFISTVWTPVILAIHHYLGHVKMLMMMMMMMTIMIS